MPDIENTVCSKHVMTLKGHAYLAKQQTGAKFIVTRAVAGAGAVDEDVLEQQTEVLNPIAEMEMDERKVVDGSLCKIPVRLQNTNIKETALLRQVGIYAQDPDEGEILYQLVQYKLPHPILSLEANNGCIDIFDLDIIVYFANADGAMVYSDPGFLIPREEFEEHKNDPDAHRGLCADNYVATIDHEFDYIPIVTLYETENSLGTRDVGDFELGDGREVSIDSAVELLAGRSLNLYTRQRYPGDPRIVRYSKYKYAFMFEGSTTNLIMRMR